MRPTLTATRGFVAFRAGRIEDGRSLTGKPLRACPQLKRRLRAEPMLASEEARIGASGGEIIAAALEAIARLNDSHLKMWARYVVARTRPS